MAETVAALTVLEMPQGPWQQVFHAANRDALDDPRSTTQLAALSGLPIGAVGNHLNVMLGAGVVLRRRAGREVLYWRTALGNSLIATTHQPA
jgi:DNA-binding transcriptional ArsR family regulator